MGQVVETEPEDKGCAIERHLQDGRGYEGSYDWCPQPKAVGTDTTRAGSRIGRVQVQLLHILSIRITARMSCGGRAPAVLAGRERAARRQLYSGVRHRVSLGSTRSNILGRRFLQTLAIPSRLRRSRGLVRCISEA